MTLEMNETNDVVERYLRRRVDRDSHPKGCWEVRRVNSKDYAKIRVNGKVMKAHRVVFQALRGEIPEGLEMDHLCRNKRCVNPEHLEPVTRRENIRRGDVKAMGSWAGKRKLASV